MNKYILTFFVISFTLSCNTNKENIFTDNNLLFSVDFQNEPIYAVDTFETEIGEIIMHTFMLEESETLAKTVTYSDYPSELIKLKDPYLILESAKQGAIRSLEINTIIKDEKINQGKYPGFELIGTNEMGFYIHYKLLLKENKLFQIGILKEGDFKDSKKELDFIESFVIL